jgi:putative ABC transport system substrate-binding protein
MEQGRAVFLVVLAVFLLAASFAAEGQPAGKVPRIGILSPSPANVGRIQAIRQGLEALGYVEGRSIAIEHREATTEADLPTLATELVRLGVDVIVTAGSASIRPAMEATATIPIVMVADNADPVVAGYVKSYARPGGNVTGLTGLSRT